MQIVNKAEKIEVHGGKEQSSFSIVMNAKAFKVLSSTLYSNKIGSIVREISCNAYDAHVAAGNADLPFSIHLPDAFAPYFSVKDQGTGLSSSEIREIFTVFFCSTKDTSNDFIGSYGIGSKSVFSYTDQFTVTSIKDCKRTIYSAFISDEGIPNITEMFTSDSTEPNGVEIKMSVKREDYATFTKEVKQQLRFFKVQPLITNGVLQADPEVEYLINSKNVRINAKNNCFGLNIVQGMVGYPLRVENLKDTLDSTDIELLNNLNNYNACFYFNIGEISVTASREAVEYTKTTLENIKQKMKVIRAELADYVQEQLKQKQTDYERARYLSSSKILMDLTPGFVIKNALRMHSSYEFQLASLVKSKANLLANDLGSIGSLSTYNGKLHRYANRNYDCSHELGAVVLKDTTTSVTQKLKQILEQNKDNDVLELDLHSGVYDNALIERITDLLGGFTNIIKLSDVVLPKVAKEATVRNSASKLATYYEYDGNKNPKDWTKRYEKLSDIKQMGVGQEILYVVVDKLVLESHLDINNIREYMLLQQINITPSVIPRLVAIRKKQVEKLPSSFKKLGDYVIEQKQKYNTLDVHHTYNLHVLHTNLNSEVNSFRTAYEEFIKYAPSTEPARLLKFAKRVQEKATAKVNAIGGSSRLNALVQFVGSNQKQAEQRIKKVRTFNNNMQKKYKMLFQIVNSYGFRADKESQKHLAVYCQAVYNLDKTVV